MDDCKIGFEFDKQKVDNDYKSKSLTSLDLAAIEYVKRYRLDNVKKIVVIDDIVVTGAWMDCLIRPLRKITKKNGYLRR